MIKEIKCGVCFMEKQLIKKILVNTKDLIHSDSFLKKHRLNNRFTRQGKLSFTDIMYFILSRENKSISINISNMRRFFPQLKIPPVSKQAISKARQKVSSDACLELCHLFTKLYYKQKKKQSLWHGYHIYAIDGSTIQIPVSDENIGFWGSNPNQYGIEEPLASASMLYDVMDGIIMDSLIGKYRLNERESANKHIDFFITQNICGKHVFLFDRGYPSYELFEKLISNKLFFVMRLSLSFKKLIDKQNEDTIIVYHPKGKKRALTLRTFHFLLPDGSIEYLVTNIISPDFKLETFKELYFLRWGIESRYKELKMSFRLESFSGYKPEIIKQDFYAAVFLSNLASITKNLADSKIDKKETNSYLYQANKNFIISQMKANIISVLLYKGKRVIKLIDKIIDEASLNRSEIRPGRKYPRHKKYTRRKYFINNKPCL